MVASDSTERLVDVTLVLDTIPEAGRHRVTVSTAGGAVVWTSSGLSPPTAAFEAGEMLTARASIAARRGATSNARPSREWHVRVEPGSAAVLTLSTGDPFRPDDRLEIHVQGARLCRSPRRDRTGE